MSVKNMNRNRKPDQWVDPGGCLMLPNICIAQTGPLREQVLVFTQRPHVAITFGTVFGLWCRM